MSRERARELGLKRYFSNTPCPRGHVAMFNTAQGYCLACNAERLSGWREGERPSSKPRDPREDEPMSRERARALGLSRFTPESPCPAGHTSKVHTSRGYCIACRTEYQRKRRSGQLPPKAHTGQFQYLSPEALAAVQAYAAQWLEFDRSRPRT